MNFRNISLVKRTLAGLFFVVSFSFTARSQSQLTVNLVRGDEIDRATIWFYEGGTRRYGDHRDTVETFPGGFNLYTVSEDGELLNSNGLPQFDCDENVGLVFFNATEGHYDLKFLPNDSFPEQIEIELIDNFLNTTTKVIDESVYGFDVTSNPGSYYAGRFEIRFHATPALQDFAVRGSSRCSGLDGEIEISNTQQGTIYTIMRDNFAEASIAGTGGTIRYIVSDSSTVDGVNVFQVTSGFSYCQTRDHKNVAVVVYPQFAASSVVDGQRCDEGTVELKATTVQDGAVFNWYESQESETPIITQSESTFTTPVLIQTTSYYVSLTTVLGCEGPKKKVVAEISMPHPVSIIASADTLRSNYTFANQWYLNGIEIPGASAQDYLATETGVYTVEVNTRFCTSTASFVYGDYQVPIVISAHPNPVASMVTVQISGNVLNLAEIRVLNTVGLHVATVALYAEGGKLVGQINMTDFPAGIYVIRTGGEQSSELKLIKQ